jgi:hypothetical protein
MVHGHIILWTQSVKLRADFIGNGGIADFGRVSRLSRLNSGPKPPAQTSEKTIFFKKKVRSHCLPNLSHYNEM